VTKYYETEEYQLQVILKFVLCPIIEFSQHVH